MSLILFVDADTKKATSKIKKASKQVGTDIKNLEQKSVASTNKMRQSFGGLTGSIGALRNKLLVFGFATAGVLKLFKTLITESSDLEESLNAVNVVFKNGAKIIRDFGETAAVAVGLANSEFNQLAAVTGALLRDVGLPLDEVANLTITLTKRAADLASVFNTEVSDAMGAVNAAIRGETEAIRRFGGDVTDASLQQFLLAQGINKVVSSMTQQEKRLLRIRVLFSQTEDVQDDFKNTQSSLANATRTLGSRMKDLAADIGDGLVPAAENAVSIMGKLLDIQEKIEKFREKFSPGLGIVADDITRMRIAIQKMGEESPEEINKLAVAFKSGIPLAQLFFLSIDEGFDRVREKKIELPEFLLGRGEVPLKGFRTELGLIKKQTESLATIEVVTLLTAFENVKIEAFNTRNEILKSQGILVDIDLIMLRQLESMEETAELWQTEMNPAAAAYLEKLREAQGLLGIPDLPDDIKDVNKSMEAAAIASGRFSQNLVRALISGQGLEKSLLNAAINLGLSFLPGGSLFAESFAHGGIAPGGFVPSIVGEGGGAPEIVQSASPIRVTPLTTNNNTNNFGGLNFVFPNIKSIDRFTLENEIMPQIKEIISEGGII